MLWLFRFLCGYITIKIYGDFPVKIFNLAAKNRIFLWNTKLLGNGIEACVTVRDFKRMPDIIKKSGMRIHILGKHGAPFKIYKNRKRLGIVTGLIIFIVFLNLFSSYIWIIDITGNSTVETTEIIKALNDIGISEGIPKKQIHAKTQREKLLLQNESLAWASLNVEGCRLTVNVTEVKMGEKSEHLPSNLKATNDGIIKKIDITSGNCVVKIGDAVKKGDLLVSGIIEKADGTQFVYSAGTVTAVTEYKFEYCGKFKEQKYVPNGKSKNKYVLELFTLKIPLYLGSETKEYYAKTEQRTLSLFGQTLPIKLYKKHFDFAEKRMIESSAQKLKEDLTKRLETKLKSKKWISYEVKEISFKEDEKGITLLSTVSAEENIVFAEDILL